LERFGDLYDRQTQHNFYLDMGTETPDMDMDTDMDMGTVIMKMDTVTDIDHEDDETRLRQQQLCHTIQAQQPVAMSLQPSQEQVKLLLSQTMDDWIPTPLPKTAYLLSSSKMVPVIHEVLRLKLHG